VLRRDWSSDAAKGAAMMAPTEIVRIIARVDTTDAIARPIFHQGVLCWRWTLCRSSPAGLSWTCRRWPWQPTLTSGGRCGPSSSTR
jgi:hypothetical protein